MTGQPHTAEEVQAIISGSPAKGGEASRLWLMAHAASDASRDAMWDWLEARYRALAESHELLRARLEQAERGKVRATARMSEAEQARDEAVRDAEAVRRKMLHNAANLDVAIEQRQAAEAAYKEQRGMREQADMDAAEALARLEQTERERDANFERAEALLALLISAEAGLAQTRRALQEIADVVHVVITVRRPETALDAAVEIARAALAAAGEGAAGADESSVRPGANKETYQTAPGNDT